MIIWQTESNKMPREIADEFAATHFRNPTRKVDYKSAKGGANRVGTEIRYTFRLVDGVKTYTLIGRTGKPWTVED